MISSTTCDCSSVALAIDALRSVRLRSEAVIWVRLLPAWRACNTVNCEAWLLASITLTAASELLCRRSIIDWISAVDFWVRWASSRTSSATTAKPRPCSPARAASIAALRANKLVCSAMERMTSRTLPICVLSVARLRITSTASLIVFESRSICCKLPSMFCWP
ncbi:hypothetical protein D3C80_1493550 [compost metagenome]